MVYERIPIRTRHRTVYHANQPRYMGRAIFITRVTDVQILATCKQIYAEAASLMNLKVEFLRAQLPQIIIHRSGMAVTLDVVPEILYWLKAYQKDGIQANFEAWAKGPDHSEPDRLALWGSPMFRDKQEGDFEGKYCFIQKSAMYFEWQMQCGLNDAAHPGIDEEARKEKRRIRMVYKFDGFVLDDASGSILDHDSFYTSFVGGWAGHGVPTLYHRPPSCIVSPCWIIEPRPASSSTTGWQHDRSKLFDMDTPWKKHLWMEGEARAYIKRNGKEIRYRAEYTKVPQRERGTKNLNQFASGEKKIGRKRDAGMKRQRSPHFPSRENEVSITLRNPESWIISALLS